jgi:hypothetical protein
MKAPMMGSRPATAERKAKRKGRSGRDELGDPVALELAQGQGRQARQEEKAAKTQERRKECKLEPEQEASGPAMPRRRDGKDELARLSVMMVARIAVTTGLLLPSPRRLAIGKVRRVCEENIDPKRKDAGRLRPKRKRPAAKPEQKGTRKVRARSPCHGRGFS